MFSMTTMPVIITTPPPPTQAPPPVAVEDVVTAYQLMIMSREREGARERAVQRQLHRRMNQTRVARCMDWFCHLAILPFFILFILIALVMTTIFCGIPFVIFMVTTIVLYYCCTRNPIPPTLLLRALLAADPDHLQHRNHAGQAGPGGGTASKWTELEIRAALIRRELVETVALVPPQQEGEPSMATSSLTATSSSSSPSSPSTSRPLGSNLLDHSNRTVPTTAWLEIKTPNGLRLYRFTAPLSFIVPSLPSSLSLSLPEQTPVTTDTGIAVAATGRAGTRTLPAVAEQVDPEEDIMGDRDVETAAATLHEGVAQESTLVAEQAAADTPQHMHRGEQTRRGTSQASSSSWSTRTSIDLDDSGMIEHEHEHDPIGAAHGTHYDNDNVDIDVEIIDDDDHPCDICLCSYQPGDVVAWSRNVDCPHYFHEDCITDWLQRKATCCSCRRDYVVVPVPADETAKQQQPLVLVPEDDGITAAGRISLG
jgi:hypothetical protein